jgi:DNA-binding FrmR family transcriptional regulator
VAHTIREKAKLLNRVRRIRGQVEAIERALEAENGCTEVLQLIAAVRGAIHGLMAEVMEDHVRMHVVDPARERNANRAEAAEELIDVMRTYLK